MKIRKILAVILICTLACAFSASALAFNTALRGDKVYGGSPSKVLVSNATRDNTQLAITIYDGCNFFTEANMTFRCYKVGDSTSTGRRSNAISFYLSDWYNNQSKSAAFINGGATASKLDLRASVPNTNSNAYATFFGLIKF